MYPDPVWVEMPEETNALVTKAVNEGKIKEWDALEIGRRAQEGMGGQWRLTPDVHFQFDERGREGIRFPDAASMEQLMREVYPDRFPVRGETAPQKAAESHTAVEKVSGRVSMRERLANAQKEAEKRAAEATVSAPSINEQKRSEL